MSTVSVTNLKNAASASNNLVLDTSGNTTAAGTVAMGSSFLRNRIINGAMVIDQRNAGASVTVNSQNDTYSVDRFLGAGQTTDGVYTLQRSTIAPSGFANSLLATVTTADASVGVSQYYFLAQKIEGFNVSDFGFGAASASTITLSFWVRSSVTGTYGGALANGAYNRSYPFTYTISSANTWEQKIVTIVGDTTGTWLTDNGIGLRVYWGLGVGSDNAGTAGSWTARGNASATGCVNWISTNGATFYITGVQLEVGTVATPFERRLYGTELALCQRYCLVWRPQVNSGATSFPTIATGYASSTSGANGIVQTPVALRATPTISFSGAIFFAAGNANGTLVSVPTVYEASNSSFWFQTTYSGTPFATGDGGILYCGNSTSNVFIASAEL